ncbi:adenosylcobinamide-phosphate guanylyltransferase [Halogranum gelatinilyticum]|uniref:Adenosylcobinamide-phosphate guanylyltransferase n=1 Tax=Halogranum gelatinilyticum TaxID=660521 RepID=A0A1G9Q791_9EURY|nr:NTP transferase domain-containing protein [Halogranum gelatinilyticum]SDM06813.1 adenosylcobinamide-phosphate guanylyltransferase [Halogranum gelatinilyticum]
MCGGRGTRLGSRVEKPLVEVCGTPMVDRVLDALAASRVASDGGEVYAVVSPDTPATREHLRGRDCTVVDAPGEGYVDDLGYALERVETPVVTVVADLPLLAPEIVNRVLDEATRPDRHGDSVTVCVPAAVKRALGASVDTSFESEGIELVPTGLNVVGGSDDHLYRSHDVRLSVNVNRPADHRLAEELCD